MKFRIRNLTHALGAVGITRGRRDELAENGVAWGYTDTITVNGLIVSTGGSSDINSQIATVQANYVSGYDASLLFPGGGKSRLLLDNSDALGGVRVVDGPNFDASRPAAFATNLPFSATLEATYAYRSGPKILAFSETVSFKGGGADIGLLVPKAGDPIPQTRRQKMPYTATQAGRAVGLHSYPIPPRPLWPPPILIVQSADPDFRSPRRRGSDNVEWEITWNYQFQSIKRLRGFPNHYNQIRGGQ